jgi:hypothetical protein
LNEKEVDILVSQFVIPSRKQLGGHLPYAFTEQGVAMLSSVLNSPKAIQVNIQIMRTFNYLRKMFLSHKDLQAKLESLESKYDSQFKSVFDAIKLLIQDSRETKRKLIYEEEKKQNKKFGFAPES